MKLRFLGGRYQGRTIDLKPESFTIGRGPDNDLILDEEGVSRRHCKISETDGQWVVDDLQSTNGVRVNGKRIESTHPLQTGDRIGIHQTLLLFSDGSDMVAPEKLEQDLGKRKPVPSQTPPAEPVEPAVSVQEDEPAALPWGRIVLLVIILLLIVWLGFITFAPAWRQPVVDVTPAAHTAVESPATDAPAVSDAELARLMATDDTDETNAPAAADSPPATGTEPAAAGFGTAPETATRPEPAAADGRASDVALIMSEPSGAIVLIDGVERGKTPLVARELSAGRHRIALQMAGYDDLLRQIHVPDVLPSEPYALRQKPGTLAIRSTPAGATVWHGTQIVGRTPCLLSQLPEGEQEIQVTAAGHEPLKQTVSISRLRGEALDLTLTSLLGAMEIATIPANCRIYIDGVFKGITSADVEAGTRQSRALRIDGLLEGEHHVKIEHPHGSTLTGRVKVGRGEATQKLIKLWIIDTKLVLNDGTVKYGMLVEKNEFGDIVLAEAQKRYERYLRPQLTEVITLTATEAQAALQELHGGPSDGKDGHMDAKTQAPDAPPQAAQPREGQAAAAEGEQMPDEAAPEAANAAEILRVKAEDLAASFRHTTATELARRYQKRRVAVTGVATGSGRDGLGGYVAFGSRIRCFIGRETYQRMKDEIDTAQETATAMTVTGTAVGISGNTLIIRECDVETAVPKEKQ